MPGPSPRARSIVLDAVTAEPTTTSALYDRIGYPGLLRAGLIDYRAFRAVLVSLEAEGVVRSEMADAGTRWRITTASERSSSLGGDAS
jgi:hypothetical protein